MPLAKPPLGSTLNSAHPLSDGLVVAFPLLEGAGPSTSCNGITASLNPTTTSANRWVGGFAGRAISFPGNTSGQGLNAGNVGYVSQDFTIAYWVLKRANTGSYSNLFGVSRWNNVSGQNEYALNIGDGIGGSQNRVDFYVSIGASNIILQSTAAQQIPLNAWTHLAGIRRGDALEIWFNGNLIQSSSGNSTATIPSTARNFKVGNSDLDLFSANAAYDAVYVWNRALIRRNIQDLYADSWAMFRRNRSTIYAPAVPTSTRRKNHAAATPGVGM